MNPNAALLALLLIATGTGRLSYALADEPLKGRVETIEGGSNPALPEGVLSGSARQSAEQPLLPKTLRGKWWGYVRITQMETYEQIHDEPYCQAFIQEIKKSFHEGQRGQIALEIKPAASGDAVLSSSDLWFAHGLRVQLTSAPGPALVAGGTNIPRTLKNDVTPLDAGSIEQSRFDQVTIVDKDRRPIHAGFSEVSALYKLAAPRRLRIKILTVDYDQQGKPLWKSLMEGEATR